MNYGFIKTACATPTIKVADCVYNSEQIISQITYATQQGASLVVFPELCVTGYTCGDMFLQRFLIDSAENAVEQILNRTRTYNIISVVGVPILSDTDVFNCSVVMYHGEILGIVPKVNIPDNNEYQETRYFKSGKGMHKEISYAGQKTTLGYDLIFCCNQLPDFKFAVEIGEDVYLPCASSMSLCADGNALLICNPVASCSIPADDYRKELIAIHAKKMACAYVSSCAGPSESTTDVVFNAQNYICENGEFLAQSKKYDSDIIYGDIDLQLLNVQRRLRNLRSIDNNFKPCNIYFNILLKQCRLERKYNPQPFMPSDKAKIDGFCEEVLSAQAIGLATRMKNASITELVIGVSGGLDSTLALIVSIRALDILQLPHTCLHAVSMPCFGTTSRTKTNAEKLALSYGAKIAVVDISRSVRQHFADIGHNESKMDTTFENAQARQRTLVLMDLANKFSALVVGTGDLSELALGWATYNGDHMSMYSVNASVPKTMARQLVAYEANNVSPEIRKIVYDILDTPVSPELLPPDKDGQISQVTEDVVGPYELHDFFLYYFIKYGFSPEKIFYIALNTFEGVYDRYTIKKWMLKFFARFFSQQFKRSCMPDGPKVSEISLSPRTGFKMPSDVQATLWIDRINEL